MKPALMLVDLQEDFLAAPGLEPCAGEVVAGAARLLDGFRAHGAPVIHVQTTVDPSGADRMPHWKRWGRWLCVRGTPGHAPPPSLRPLAEREPVLDKTHYSAFGTPSLEPLLRSRGVDTVVLAGVHLHACVRQTAFDAYQHGFDVVVADEAVASDDPLHAASTRRYLDDRVARFEPIDRILAQLTAIGAAAVGARPHASQSVPPVLPAVLSLGGADSAPPVRPPRPDAHVLVHASPRRAGATLWQVPICDRETVAAACRTAKAAWPSWRDAPRAARARVLEAFAGLLESERERLVEQLAIEVGKPVALGDAEVTRAIALVRATLAGADAVVLEGRGDGGVYRRVPLGLVALLTPWNSPLDIPAGKLAPALVWGNVVAWKPAPAGAGLAVAVMDLLARAGCPAGVVTMLNGDPSTGRALARDPGVDGVSLTGSSLAGHALAEICARRRVPFQAELGGNNAAIVWRDADLDAAAREIAIGAFGYAGQRCTANRRAIVDQACFGEFKSALEREADRLIWGDPLHPSTQVGPLISVAARERIAALLARSASQVDEIRVGRAPFTGDGLGPESGAYHPAAIAYASRADTEIVEEESFGPLLVVQKAASFDEALHLCGAPRQGLAAALFTGSLERQRRFLSTVRCGILKINRATVGAGPDLPFGGWKDSGMGPAEHGVADVDLYLRMQAIYGREL